MIVKRIQTTQEVVTALEDILLCTMLEYDINICEPSTIIFSGETLVLYEKQVKDILDMKVIRESFNNVDKIYDTLFIVNTIDSTHKEEFNIPYIERVYNI